MANPDPYMSDAQVYNRTAKSIPYWNDFSTDAFYGLDPAVRGVVADAHLEGKGDPIDTYAILRDQEYKTALIDSLMQDYVRNSIRAGGALTESDAEQAGVPLERLRRDQMKEYGAEILDNFMAGAAPSAQRNVGLIDWASQRYDGIPYSGGQVPQMEGPGFERSGGGGGGGAPAPQRGGQRGAYTRALAAYNMNRRR